MPGVYREKNCKYCGKLYRKKGIYCSQSCASSDKEPTDKMRSAMRKVAIEHNRTPEAIAQQKLLHTGITIEDFAVDIPSLPPDLSDYNDYNKAEDW